jgi:hypothetical protein
MLMDMISWQLIDMSTPLVTRLNIISRLFFLIVFLLAAGGLVAWEVNSLMALNQKENTQAYAYNSTDSQGLILGAAGNYDADEETVMTANMVAEDARPMLIKKYLEKYKSPLVPYSEMIYQVSQDYGLDYRYIVAIAQQESNLCKKIPDDSYNCWGYGIHAKGTLRFENYELAIKSYAEYLKREYFDKGLNTPELIMKKYCPNSNGSWAFGVNKFLDDIERGDS